MKRSMIMLFAAVGFGILALGWGQGLRADDSEQSGSYVIGLSPFLERDVKDDVYRKVIALVVEDLPLGSKLTIYDAYNLQTITEISVPDRAAFRSAKTRANQFAPQVLRLRKFLGTEHELPESGETNAVNAVRLPQFLDFLCSASRETNSGKAIVVVLGSPLYLDSKEEIFSMTDGFFPSDGHLKVSRERSVYGVAGRENALKGMQVHFCYFGDPWVSDLYQEKIARFWHLFMKLQGGELATFSGDLVSTFKNATARAVAPSQLASAQLEAGDEKLEMLRVTRDVTSRDWITRDDVIIARSAPSRTVGPMKIGIRWQGDWDLDLYATPHPGAETLFFQHMRCPEGYYYKDHRSSPGREYEFIEFTSPVNIREVEALVNFYQGQARDGASGEVRIEFENKIYSGRFHIPASKGNRGRYDDEQRDYWVTIDLGALMHLGENSGALASRRRAATR